MRVDIASTGEVRDALDSNWPIFLNDIGFQAIYLPHTVISSNIVEELGLHALILTGGNDVLESGNTYNSLRSNFEQELLVQAEQLNTPVLGVCRGTQMINKYFGGKLSPIENHVACNLDVINSYHNFGIHKNDVASDLHLEAIAEDGSIEALSHKKLPWFGMMWHPERKIIDPEFHSQLVQKILNGALK